MAMHHRKGEIPKVSSAKAKKLLSNEEVKAHLESNYNLIKTYDIPYLAGYSKDGKHIYFDRHLKLITTPPDSFDVTNYLIIHERVEKALIDVFDYTYETAHAVALRCEYDAVVGDGHDWKKYSDYLKPFIKSAEHEKLEKVPGDLDLTPYEDDNDLDILNRLKKTTVKTNLRSIFK